MRLGAVLFLLAPLCFAQGAKILIATDLEGVGGVTDAEEQLLPGQRRYMESRRLLIGEVRAATDGAFAAGASAVDIWDGHDGSRTLSIDELNACLRPALEYDPENGMVRDLIARVQTK